MAVNGRDIVRWRRAYLPVVGATDTAGRSLLSDAVLFWMLELAE
jgi:hypothetical protein